MVQPVATTILVGVAAMRRKLNSAPMQAILASLRQANPHFHLVIFDDVQMACDPHTWPRVHVLLTLYSANFPLQNVLDYIALHNPLLVNNLHRQHCMQDRREVRRVLASAHVPTPDAVCVDRTAGDVITQTGQSDDTLVILRPDHSVATIRKPFVEKPVDPEDHSKSFNLVLPFLFRSRCPSPFSHPLLSPCRCLHLLQRWWRSKIIPKDKE